MESHIEKYFRLVLVKWLQENNEHKPRYKWHVCFPNTFLFGLAATKTYHQTIRAVIISSSVFT